MISKSENEFLKELLADHTITASDVDRLAEYQKAKKVSLIEALLALRIGEEHDILRKVAQSLTIDYVSTQDEVHVEKEARERIPAKVAINYQVVPLSIRDGKLRLCVANPFHTRAIDDLRTIANGPVEFVVARAHQIGQVITNVYGVGAHALESIAARTSIEKKDMDVSYEKVDAITDDASIVSYVNQILLEAHRQRATDIHIEPFAHEVAIRYRIDGVLHDITVPKQLRSFYSSLLTRIKIIANLDIAEHRLPQDGRIKIATKEGLLDVRVSMVPTPFGESVSIRLLSSAELLSLERIGCSPEQLQKIQAAISKSHGIIFLTGPTGSGKTTTLYSCLQRMNKRDRKIITIEDPIEYQLEGVTQIQVHPKIGLTFSAGLRSVLRHDPDVLMVGEVRDMETAEIAIRSALTGHIVLSTLHTNDAPSALERLIDMGIPAYLLSSSIECIIAQRLVRVLCPSCKKAVEYTPQDVRGSLGIAITEAVKCYEPVGCHLCAKSGYKDRTAIMEIMMMNDDMRALLHGTPSHAEMKALARRSGMQTLREDGWHKVAQGVTSLEEVVRVTQE